MRQPPKVGHDVDTCEKNGSLVQYLWKNTHSKYSTTEK